MALKTFVKVSNVSSLSDARYCAGMGVDILGFNIDPDSTERLDETTFKEITDWVAGVEFAGEFHDSNLQGIKDAVKAYPIQFVELSNLDLIEKVALLGKPLIYKASINSEDDLGRFGSTLSYLDELVQIVIIKSTNESIFNSLDQQITFYNGNLKLVRGYGVSPDSGVERFPGIEMEATKEEKPGLKDYGEIMDVLEVLDED
ncbi:MAG: hypothetical protein RIM99_09650 [Cyclobacteriaceae bacterium]